MSELYEDWLMGVWDESEEWYPDRVTIVRRTHFGCCVVDLESDEILDEFDYEPDPYAEQRVRY